MTQYDVFEGILWQHCNSLDNNVKYEVKEDEMMHRVKDICAKESGANEIMEMARGLIAMQYDDGFKNGFKVALRLIMQCCS